MKCKCGSTEFEVVTKVSTTTIHHEQAEGVGGELALVSAATERTTSRRCLVCGKGGVVTDSGVLINRTMGEKPNKTSLFA